jgi:hypothetical protein
MIKCTASVENGHVGVTLTQINPTTITVYENGDLYKSN